MKSGGQEFCPWRLNRGPGGPTFSEMRHSHTTREANTHDPLVFILGHLLPPYSTDNLYLEN